MTTFDETSKIWKGKKVPISYQRDIHISEIILKNLKKTPSRVLQIYDENGAQMTCDELRLNATRVAQNLTNIGIKQGDVVGFNCSSSENICALLHGCIFIGAIINPMALKQDKSDLIHMWSQTQPKFIFCDAEVYEKVVEALNQMNNNAVVCTLIKRIDNAMFVDDFLATTGNEKSFEPLKNDNSEDSLILLSSSSGTTGPAKAVRIPQSYILLLADMLSVEMRLLNFTPMFWYLSLLLFIILPLTKLTRVVTRRLESVENCLELVEKFKVEQLYASPALLNKIIQYPFIETANLSSLKIVTSGGATVHPDLRIKFKQTFPGKRLLAVYGTTEMVFVEPLLSDENEGHTVGRPFPNSEIKIVDDNGNNLGIDESGEICAKPMFSFSGYYRKPEASKAAVDKDNFFKTGDIGYFNQNGMLSVVGRKKDIFKYYFHHINPTEIENVIQLLDGVELVSVVGIPNEESNSLTCAVVIKREGFELISKDDIITYVAERLPEYKQLHGGVVFVEKFPTTPSGKIIRRLVTEIAEKEFMQLKSNGHNGQHNKD